MANARDTQAIFSRLIESRNTKMANAAKKSPVTEKKAIKETKKSENSFLTRALESMEPDVMDDVIDNIQVVTDPEKTVDDLEVRADAVQDAIDNAPEGEEAFSDEYVGDTIYACPVCGESFFADDTYQEGDMCPICKAEPTDGFLNQGTVVASDEAGSEEDIEGAEAEDADAEIPEVEEDEIGVSADEPDEEDKDESKEEGKSCNNKNKDELVEGIDVDDIDDECDCEVVECDQLEYLDTELDEESLEGLLSEFLHENYGKTVKSIKIETASYDKSRDIIKVEGKMILKNGKYAPIKLEMKEAKYNNDYAVFTAKECSNVFKMEKSSAPFKFKVRNINNKLTFEAMNYRYISSHPTVGRVMVEGKAVKSNKKRSKKNL